MVVMALAWANILFFGTQVEMSGSSIFDYIHHSDHAEMAEQLGLGLSQSQGLSSPASGADDVNSSSGTNNPDGMDQYLCLFEKTTIFFKPMGEGKPLSDSLIQSIFIPIICVI